MYKINYTLTKGKLPINVTLYSGSTENEPIGSNNHIIYQDGSFEDLTPGDYVLYFEDLLGCIGEELITIDVPTPTPTATPTPTPTVTMTPTPTPTPI